MEVKKSGRKLIVSYDFFKRTYNQFGYYKYSFFVSITIDLVKDYRKRQLARRTRGSRSSYKGSSRCQVMANG